MAGRVAGPHVRLSREGVLQPARALLRGDPRATLGLVEPGAVTLDDARAAVAATHGYTFDTPRAAIDPDCTIAGAERAVDASVRRSRRRVGASRSRPAGPRRCSCTTSSSRAAPRNTPARDVVALEQSARSARRTR